VSVYMNDVSLNHVVFAAEEGSRTLQAAAGVSLRKGMTWQGL